MTFTAAALILGTAVSGGLGIYARRHRSVPGARAFSLLAGAIGVWCLAAAGEGIASSFEAKFFWSQLTYLGIAPTPVLWFLFALDYVGSARRPRWRGLSLLAIVPAATICLIWTSRSHSLIWRQVEMASPSLIVDHGIWFERVHVPFSWGLLALGLAILARHLFRVTGADRVQCALVVSAATIPLAANASYVLGIGPFTYDPTPIAFNLAAIAIGWALYSFRFLNFTPVGYEIVFQSIGDPVFMLDSDDRLMMANAAAIERVGGSLENLRGQHASSIFRRWPGVYGRLRDARSSQVEITVENARGKADLSLRVFPLIDRRGRLRGRVIVLQDVTQSKHMRRLEDMAYRDFVTGVSNRYAFQEAAESAIAFARRRKLQLAVVLLDLDGFKQVNDKLGHSSGDLLLELVASRLRAAVREEDLVARHGGDEFALLIQDCDLELVTTTVHRVIREIKHHAFEVNNSIVRLDFSAGIAIFPESGQEIEELIARADSAMYEAKQGIGGIRYYDPSHDSYAQELLQLETDLRHAITHDQLKIHYQPICRAEDGSLLYAEALVRWEQPDGTVMRPSGFLPKLKQRGLARELDRHVLRQTLEELSDRSMTVAVNVSTESAIDPQFPNAVRSILDKTGFDPSRLILEINEEDLTPPERAKPILRAICSLGVRLAADDFGVGYSSLAYLRHFPLTTLKLDRSLVSGIGERVEDEAIIRAIIAMATSLGLETVAEGVETEEQLRWLAATGCCQIQGFLFARPMPLVDLEDRFPPTSTGDRRTMARIVKMPMANSRS